jgi:hypothetical protein
VGLPVTFAANVSPLSATGPVTYTWEATGQAPAVHVGGLSDTATFTWNAPGANTVTVTAQNVDGQVSQSKTFTVDERALYLPLLVR